MKEVRVVVEKKKRIRTCLNCGTKTRDYIEDAGNSYCSTDCNYEYISKRILRGRIDGAFARAARTAFPAPIIKKYVTKLCEFVGDYSLLLKLVNRVEPSKVKGVTLYQKAAYVNACILNMYSEHLDNAPVEVDIQKVDVNKLDVEEEVVIRPKGRMFR